MRILLADDDEDILDVTSQLLGRAGWEVTTAQNARAALEVLVHEHFDALVLDQDMPPGSGMDVAAARRAEGDRVPIVLWTGWAGTLDPAEVTRLQLHVLNKAEVRRLSEVLTEITAGSAS